MRPYAIHGARGDKLEKKGDMHNWNDLETFIESATKISNVSILTTKTSISFRICTKRTQIFPNWRIEIY